MTSERPEYGFGTTPDLSYNAAVWIALIGLLVWGLSRLLGNL